MSYNVLSGPDYVDYELFDDGAGAVALRITNTRRYGDADSDGDVDLDDFVLLKQNFLTGGTWGQGDFDSDYDVDLDDFTLLKQNFLTAAAVPEPGTLMLLVTGGVMWIRRRR